MEHRRDDGEALGELEEVDGGWIAVDRLGRRLTRAVDLPTAEAALDERGLAYLADPYELELEDGTVERVRLVEVRPDRIRVKREDFNAIDAPQVFWDLPIPAPDSLRRR